MANCRWFAVILIMVAAIPATGGTVLHVEGDAGALRAALAKASADPDVTEIILADGVYEGSFQLLVPKDHEGDVPRLTLRAADGAKPLLRGSVRISEAEAVDAGVSLDLDHEATAEADLDGEVFDGGDFHGVAPLLWSNRA